jgi:hypothetical protein
MLKKEFSRWKQNEIYGNIHDRSSSGKQEKELSLHHPPENEAEINLLKSSV